MPRLFGFGKVMKRIAVIYIVRCAVVAALYFVLTFVMQPIAFGPIQFRIGEAMTLLPLIFPESIVGLTLGCLLANVLSPYGWYDMVFGTLATLIASVLTFMIGKMLQKRNLTTRALVGAIPPVLVNALILPLIWLLFSADAAYFLNFATIFFTQTAVILIVGMPLLMGLQRVKPFIDVVPYKRPVKNSEKTLPKNNDNQS